MDTIPQSRHRVLPGSGVARGGNRRSLPTGSLRNPSPARGISGLDRLRRRPTDVFLVTSRASAARRVGRPGGLVVVSVFEKFTEKAIKVTLKSQNAAKYLGHQEVASYHIFLGLVEQSSSKDGFMGTGLMKQEARTAVEAIVGSSTIRRTKDLRDIPFSHDAKELLERAEMEANRMDAKYVCEDHLVIALMSGESEVNSQIFRRLGLNPDKITEIARKKIAGDQAFDRAEVFDDRSQQQKPEAKKHIAESNEAPKTILEELCRDLCADAVEGKIEPIIGRVKEIQRVIQILGRRRKNNPVLLGEAGVGKTAIAEGIACALVSGFGPDGTPIPEFLKGMRVMQLDVALLMAGAKERGELERRVTSLVDEVSNADDIILMIDEVHTLVGAGAVGRSGLGSGGLDIANMIKPALARGDLQCIGATTIDEFRKYIESDKALARRFQPVDVPEPTPAEALALLQGVQGSFEKHHKCIFTDEAIKAAVALSCRYIADRHLPDKAIDVLDEAGSRVRIASFHARKERPGFDVQFSEQVWEELNQVVEAKQLAVKEGLFEEASLLRSRENDLKGEISGPPEDCAVVPVVDVQHIEAVVAAWSGIPVEKLSTNDVDKLITLEERLRDEIIGQDQAVSSVSRAMCRSYSLIRDPKRPIASFLFCGPTGVGKTELTKVLGDHCFGTRDDIIRLDMSEYMERFSVSKLIGAPPGYVGYGEGGKLTEPVRRRPYSVILFDEIEKAHPDVFNMLLQILEDGRLSDSQGRVVSFKNTMIIMTSNIGSNVIAKGGGQIGFQLMDDAEAGNYARIKNLVKEELKVYFRPEMLNRIDEVVVFDQLSMPDIHKIADIILRETAELLIPRGISLRVTLELKQKICQDGYDKSYGARPLRREIMRVVNDTLSEAILGGEIKEGDVALLDVDSEGEVVMRKGDEIPNHLVVELKNGDYNDVVVYPISSGSSVQANV
ncbi:hypothetical protein BSKO_09154 [Bryopsis sp. KO-2023]|nr:hypothetical protein BSKO_09154 [Bryopsis sp. KO-2023]